MTIMRLCQVDFIYKINIDTIDLINTKNKIKAVVKGITTANLNLFS